MSEENETRGTDGHGCPWHGGLYDRCIKAEAERDALYNALLKTTDKRYADEVRRKAGQQT